MFRAPLLYPSDAVISPLDIDATWAANPPGTPATGYDKKLREPYPKQVTPGGPITDYRVYGAQIRVPCQVEIKTFEELRDVADGDAALTKVVLVFHMQDLEELGLFVPATGVLLLKKGDRLDSIEEHDTAIVIQPLAEPTYLYRLDPDSWGFGRGYDLKIGYTTSRPAEHRGR